MSGNRVLFLTAALIVGLLYGLKNVLLATSNVVVTLDNVSTGRRPLQAPRTVIYKTTEYARNHTDGGRSLWIEPLDPRFERLKVRRLLWQQRSSRRMKLESQSRCGSNHNSSTPP